MKNSQKGFTLIELIVVIIILGILAAVALPRFIDLTDEALEAASQGVAGAIRPQLRSTTEPSRRTLPRVFS